MSLETVTKQIFAALVGSIQTAQTQSQTLTNLTNTTNQLQQSWLDGIGTTSSNPFSTYPQATINENPALVTADANTFVMNNQFASLQSQIANKTLTGTNAETAISNFTTQFMTATNTVLFSSAGVTAVMGLLNSVFESNQGPPILGFLNSYQTIVTSESTKELNPGQTLIKSEGSVIQSDSSSQQPLSDAGNSFMQLIGSIATSLQGNIF